MSEVKTRAVKRAPDIACFTVILDRTDGSVEVDYEPEFVREWETEYAVMWLYDRVTGSKS